MRMHSIPLAKKKAADAKPGSKPLVAFVNPLPFEKADAEIKDAYRQLSAFTEFNVEYLTTGELAKQPGKTGQYSAIWIHRPDTLLFGKAENNPKLVQTLKDYVENGGRLLLTLQAVHYLNLLGFETTKLQDSTKRCVDEGYGRRLGFHACREHPLFTGLNGGAYICRPAADITVRVAGLFGDNVPQQGKVAAVDWDYIFLREESKLVLDYSPGKGKVLAVGGYMNFSIPNSNDSHLALFTRNCFNYLLDQYNGMPLYYWDYSPARVVDCPPLPETDQLLVAVPPSVKWEESSTGIDLKRRYASGNFWDVAGERMLTMGSENGGIEEVWSHPFMALRDYEAGIQFEYNDTILWLSDERPEITVNPAFFSRQYKFRRAYLEELMVNDPSGPAGVIHYAYRGVYPCKLIIRFKSTMRWMWPYSERVTGSICHSWDAGLNAIAMQDGSGDMNVMIGATKKPVYHISGQFDGFSYSRKDTTFQGIPTGKLQAGGLLCYNLGMNEDLDVVFSASAEGYADTHAQFDKTLHNPALVYQDAIQHSRDILANNLVITTPDSNFNTGYRWALLAADRFFVNTPGMGKALVAGYSTTRHGWDGGHKVNGRPGYGWYFGRDAEWSSFALLDCGDFGKVKSQLEFFNTYQDLNGKIFHEASTSGLIHYDAADATPLYIVLAGKYFRHTNDTAFLRKIWPNVKRALNFCFLTDTDHDHLVENTNVGHGWVEGGELYGSHATIYMAGAWGAALREAANMAGFMKDVEEESYRLESGEQAGIINSRFWSDKEQYFAYGMNKDGSFRTEQTILPSVPIYFRMADPDKSALVLKNIAGNAFTTNWGARILREDSPWFKPTGYHYGSVWPLFTGWASLAEYTTYNPVQGFSHLMNNLDVYKNWGLGFVEEVLNGAEYQPSGVCAHQCWSETMVLQPAIEGMLGLETRAQERKMFLAPQFPPQWDSIDIRHIRMADQRVDLHFTRMNGANEYRFSLDQGAPVRIEFMPSFPAGTRFVGVTLNGKVVPFTSFKSAQSMTLIVSFDLGSDANLVVETGSGISVLSVVSDPRPGDPAEGLRIISARLSGNSYEVEVQGKAGSSGVVEFWSGGEELHHADNARYLGQDGRTYRFAVDFERSELKYSNKTVSIPLTR
ncbi:MAG: GH116 family glycosyl hydrolase [Bacteroidetes bacterium]|nr:GH116 family glycosyl hydrolase [Bacteroidota bacterium]